jgi:hypothetical protein
MGLVEEGVERASPRAIFAFLAVGFVLWRIYLKIDETTRLRRLGSRAVKLNKGRLPFGAYLTGLLMLTRRPVV